MAFPDIFSQYSVASERSGGLPPSGRKRKPRRTNESDHAPPKPMLTRTRSGSHNRWMRRKFYVLPDRVGDVKSLLETTVPLKSERMQHLLYFDNGDSELFRDRLCAKELSSLVRLSWNRECTKGSVHFEVETYHKHRMREVQQFEVSIDACTSLLKGELHEELDPAVKQIVEAGAFKPVVLLEYWRSAFELCDENGELTCSVKLDENLRCARHCYETFHVDKSEADLYESFFQYPYALLSVHQVLEPEIASLVDMLLEKKFVIEVSRDFHKYVASYAKLNGIPDVVPFKPSWVSVRWGEIADSIVEQNESFRVPEAEDSFQSLSDIDSPSSVASGLHKDSGSESSGKIRGRRKIKDIFQWGKPLFRRLRHGRERSPSNSSSLEDFSRWILDTPRNGRFMRSYDSDSTLETDVMELSLESAVDFSVSTGTR